MSDLSNGELIDLIEEQAKRSTIAIVAAILYASNVSSNAERAVAQARTIVKIVGDE